MGLPEGKILVIDTGFKTNQLLKFEIMKFDVNSEQSVQGSYKSPLES